MKRDAIVETLRHTVLTAPEYRREHVKSVVLEGIIELACATNFDAEEAAQIYDGIFQELDLSTASALFNQPSPGCDQ